MIAGYMATTELILRARPQQARSQATMERLLEVAEALLIEVGIDGFNTNLLAKRAGVGVRALYRYFPNKWAVLVELGNRSYKLERIWVDNLDAFQPGADWRAGIDQVIDGFYAAARLHPGYAALRAVSQISPQLREIDAENNRQFEREVAQTLKRLGLATDERRLRILSQVLIETSGRLLDLALQADAEDAALLIDELKRIMRDLLGHYLGA